MYFIPKAVKIKSLCTSVFSEGIKDGVQASHCNGFSCYGAQARRDTNFNSGGAWAQELRLPGCKRGSVEVGHGLRSYGSQAVSEAQ